MAAARSGREIIAAEGAITSPAAGAAALAGGGMVILVDAADRENEGDFVLAAEHATPAALNFMTTHGRGLICVPMPLPRLDELQIPEMSRGSSDAFRTAFHVSVDAREGTSTGVSAADRSATVRALASASSTASTFRRPGHVLPLAYRPGGVLARAGHTEGSVDLAVLGGCAPVTVICEILSEDGSPARLPELLEIGRRHGLPTVSIADLIGLRSRSRKAAG
ncbi:MAG: 3,4-dihydroxy-2-butanone-4-phosphate synthase [Solirubrobacterales bacterium 70-9]|nr:MAG: 3,4-dihydroxy-2-butanone-4-phosphate synthase [Solirubrobacterales bacterium 70-9]